jgi:hypothetical protein
MGIHLKFRSMFLIRCGRVYDALAAFSLTHGGRPIKLSHPRRRLKTELIITRELLDKKKIKSYV